MDSTLLPFALLCFTSFFTLTNPLGTMPVFLTMTHGMTDKERQSIVQRATIVSFVTLMVFVFAGQFLFKFFGISTDGFRIAGGVIIFKIGFDMLQARYTPMKLKDEEIKTYADDISITPLGIPMLCGPGAIANAIVLIQLKEKVKNNKINLEFDFGKGYSYNWEEHTLHIGLEELEANNLLHEMFHVFQTTQEPISSFKSSMMNREIEAHYAQYLFLQRSAEWTDKKQDKYAKSQRLRATTSLTKYVNQQGHVTTSFLDIFETYISNNVVNAFRQEGYDNYPFKEYSDITNIFPNIKLTTKNCDE